MLPSVGKSVQATVVLLVVVGQLPQWDARMLYSTYGHCTATGLQVKDNLFNLKSARLMYSLSGGELETAMVDFEYYYYYLEVGGFTAIVLL